MPYDYQQLVVEGNAQDVVLTMIPTLHREHGWFSPQHITDGARVDPRAVNTLGVSVHRLLDAGYLTSARVTDEDRRMDPHNYGNREVGLKYHATDDGLAAGLQARRHYSHVFAEGSVARSVASNNSAQYQNQYQQLRPNPSYSGSEYSETPSMNNGAGRQQFPPRQEYPYTSSNRAPSDYGPQPVPRHRSASISGSVTSSVMRNGGGVPRDLPQRSYPQGNGNGAPMYGRPRTGSMSYASSATPSVDMRYVQNQNQLMRPTHQRSSSSYASSALPLGAPRGMGGVQMHQTPPVQRVPVPVPYPVPVKVAVPVPYAVPGPTQVVHLPKVQRERPRSSTITNNNFSLINFAKNSTSTRDKDRDRGRDRDRGNGHSSSHHHRSSSHADGHRQSKRSASKKR